MVMRLAFYKSTRPGLAGIYNRGVRIVTKGHYSHCEAIFSDGMSASSSYADGGVRFKAIDYDPEHWDFITIPDYFEPIMRRWFEDNEGMGYDLSGNLHFLVPFIGDAKHKVCCSEALAAAMGFVDPWRYHPSSFFAILTSFSRFNNWDGVALNQFSHSGDLALNN